MSTDRELLELAAKAAGIKAKWFRVTKWKDTGTSKISTGKAEVFGTHHSKPWNPLTDDGDALRLAVKLRLVVHVWDDEGAVSVAKTLDGGADPHVTDGDSWFAASGASQEENARRAIVQCAAEIGRSMP